MIVASGATSRTSSTSAANSLGRPAPPVPTVGERHDLAHLRGATADPHRIVAVPRAARTASCNAMTRSTIVPNSRPNASFSARLCESPAPIAAISRPSLTRCAVRKQLASVAGGPQRRARDERADVDPARLRRDRAEQREALERGPAIGRIAAPQVVEHEHARRARRLRPRARPRSGSRDPRRTTAASSPTRTLTSAARARAPPRRPRPARSPSCAGTIGIFGR